MIGMGNPDRDDLMSRAPLETSRKWGTYFFAAMLVKTYFRLNKPGLSANVQKAVGVADLPPLIEFPRSHVVTWKYYCGVFAFGKEDYEMVSFPITNFLTCFYLRRNEI
jgi:COP9 signalosome complex subunit 12